MQQPSHIGLLLGLSFLLFTGCATTLDVSANKRTKIFNASYTDTFRTIIQVFSEEGYLIDNADQETGIITTDYSEVSNSSSWLSSDRRIKANAVIQELNTGTQIRLTMSVQSQDSSGTWSATTMSKANAQRYYNTLFAKFGRRLGK